MTKSIAALKQNFRLVLLLASLLGAGTALAFGVTCPIDDSSSYFTGTTRVDGATGKLLKLYKCPRGHEFWSVD